MSVYPFYYDPTGQSANYPYDDKTKIGQEFYSWFIGDYGNLESLGDGIDVSNITLQQMLPSAPYTTYDTCTATAGGYLARGIVGDGTKPPSASAIDTKLGVPSGTVTVTKNTLTPVNGKIDKTLTYGFYLNGDGFPLKSDNIGDARCLIETGNPPKYTVRQIKDPFSSNNSSYATIINIVFSKPTDFSKLSFKFSNVNGTFAAVSGSTVNVNSLVDNLKNPISVSTAPIAKKSMCVVMLLMLLLFVILYYLLKTIKL